MKRMLITLILIMFFQSGCNPQMTAPPTHPATETALYSLQPTSTTTATVTASPASNQPVPPGGLTGETLADEILQNDVAKFVMMFESATGCSDFKIVDTDLVDIFLTGGWSERWTVDRCGSDATYLISFAVSPSGGTDFEVRKEKGSGHIAFTSDRSGRYQIYLMNHDGSEQTQLTDTSGDNYTPSISPDGNHIVYWHKDIPNKIFELHIMRPDGSENRVLAINTLYHSGWSPDGERVVYAGVAKEYVDLFEITVKGGKSNQITDNEDVELWPAISPDGTTIAFAMEDDQGLNIYLIDSDGRNKRRLIPEMNINQWEPNWSPDGTQIAFSSGNDVETQVFIVNVDGSNLVQLTNDHSYNENPVWSPDGTMIAFWSNRTGNGEIFSIYLDGTGLRNLTNNPAEDQNPFWSK